MSNETFKSLNEPRTDLKDNDDKLFNDQAFIKRLEGCANKLGSVSAFAKAAGLSQSGIRRYFTGGEPTRPILLALAKAAGVDFTWLATGEGSPAPAATLPAAPEPPGLEDFGLIPRYDVAASAGHGRLIEQEPILEHLAFRRAWLRELGLHPARCAVISIAGDSMEPTLHPGDVALLDLEHLYIRSDGLYCLRLDGGLLVKRLQRLADGVIEVISDNQAYRRFKLPDAWQGPTQQLVGRVVWAGVRF